MQALQGSRLLLELRALPEASGQMGCRGLSAPPASACQVCAVATLVESDWTCISEASQACQANPEAAHEQVR